MISLEKLVRENILKLTSYSSARDEYTGESGIFLDANENAYPRNLNKQLNRYPDPHQKVVKAKLAEIKGLKPDQIFLGNGSDEAIDLLIRIFCTPGTDEIIILPPTYGMYEVSANINDVGINKVPLLTNFSLDVESILDKASAKSKLLFICSPNNPTGNRFEAAQIEYLIQNFNGIVVIDEAYVDFSSEESAVNWINKYNNLVVLQTFSKAWGLAGIRLGMAFANPTIIGYLTKTKPPYNVNKLTQELALKALQNEATFSKSIEQINQNKQWLKSELEKLEIIEKIYPSEANFLLVKMTGANQVFQYLIDKKVIIRNRTKVELCTNCLRMTVGTKEELQHLIDQLKQYTHEKNLIS